ncbi:hypothetical protein PC123_g18903 [Phytophthora cactorum]|nr:hypothetical protein PC123_g18903 [Phytophthora cactorum]
MVVAALLGCYSIVFKDADGSNCYHVSDQQQHQIPGGSAKTFGYPTSSTLAVCALTSSKSRAKSTPVSSSSTTNSALTPTSSSTSSRAKSTPVFSSCSRAKSTEGRCRQIDFRNQRVNSTLAAGITTEARFKKYAARDSSFFYRYFYQGVVVKRCPHIKLLTLHPMFCCYSWIF